MQLAPRRVVRLKKRLPQRSLVCRRHFVWLAETVLQIGSMKRDETGPLPDRDMEQGDVAEPNEHFGVLGNDIEINVIQNSQYPVASTRTPNACCFRIGKCRHQLGGSCRIISGQVATRAIEV